MTPRGGLIFGGALYSVGRRSWCFGASLYHSHHRMSDTASDGSLSVAGEGMLEEPQDEVLEEEGEVEEEETSEEEAEENKEDAETAGTKRRRHSFSLLVKKKAIEEFETGQV